MASSRRCLPSLAGAGGLAWLLLRPAAAAVIGEPEQLCPKEQMPPEWHGRCLKGNLLYTSSQEVDHRLMPEVGNGHLARKVMSPNIYAAGLFNGDAHGSSGQASHRARLPPYNIWVKFNESVPHGSRAGPEGGFGMALDVERAAFLMRFHDPFEAPGVQVDQMWYAAMQEPTLMVHEIRLWNRADGPRTVQLGQWGASSSWSFDADLVPKERLHQYGFNPSNTHALAGTTREPELDNKTGFALAANRAPNSVHLLANESKTHYALTVIVTSLNSTDPTASALAKLAELTKGSSAAASKLFRDHAAAWAGRSEEGRVEVSGDLALAQVVNSSLYFVRSSIRPDWPHGLSPGGLASDGYSGHSFWDQETWMYPPLLMLEPDSARAVLRYRFDRRLEAQAKAQECGNALQSYCPPGYQQRLAPEAMMFPWESAFTGADVQYWGGRLGPWGRYEQHISGDIALAARQYWYVTQDKDWLREVGLPLANGTASFYVARVEWRPGTDAFDYKQVMGPDEYSWPVDNSGYTNAVAQIALRFAAEAAEALGHTGPPYWDFLYKANGLGVPAWAGPPPGRADLVGGYHPEYQNFPKNHANPKAKQADTILLAYPLGVVEDKAMIANDLDFYERITDPTGPAMTWSMFAIGWFSVKNFERSVPHFKKGFANAQAPFGVWTEFPEGAGPYPGCINFITGAGGFLQSLVYGTSGMRIKKEGLFFDPPPPRATGTKAWKLTVHSFHYRGQRLRQEVTAKGARYELLGGEGPQLCLGKAQLKVGKALFLKMGATAVIRPCHLTQAAVLKRKRRLREELVREEVILV